MLLGACTQDKMDIQPIQDEGSTLRSTQTECDSLEMNLPPIGVSNYCMKVAELFECRLNQGIHEDSLGTQCDELGTHMDTICLNINQLIPTYDSLIKAITTNVLNNVGFCPQTCFNPDPVTGCATIIFQAQVAPDQSVIDCNTGECKIIYEGKVCCQ